MAAKSLAEDFFPSFGRAVDFFPKRWRSLVSAASTWIPVGASLSD